MVKAKIPLVFGNAIEVAGTLFGISFLVLVPSVSVIALKFLVYLLAWFCFVFFPHCLAHYLVGRLVGVKFRYYSLGKSSVYKLKIPILAAIASRSVVLKLNTDRSSLESVSRGARIAMFSSGAIASMVLPFFVALASLHDLPIMLVALLFLLSGANLLFDAYYSPKAGDLSRAISTKK